MSDVIDRRVVEMQFDSEDFEQNVGTSMKLIEKLKKSLKFDDAAREFSTLEKAGKKFNLNGIANAADAVVGKLTVMGTVGDQMLRRLGDSLYSNTILKAQQFVKELTIAPIGTGFAEYETQINAIQTILSNTRDAMSKAGYSEAERLEIVTDRLDTLNRYADKTIYNFTEMTRNIGTFTAAGIELDKSVSAIQGIANLGAVSGSDSNQVSRGMYQISQALSAGTMRLMDWRSVENAGMGGEIFKKALVRTANAMGVTVDKTITTLDKKGKQVKETVKRTVQEIIDEEGSFQLSLSSGWLSADVLTETLEQFSWDFEQIAKEMGYTKENMEEGIAKAMESKRIELMAKGYTPDEADDIVRLARDATEAATKVKTLTQLMDTLKESAQSGWTQSWEYIIGDFNEAKELLTEVKDFFADIIDGSAEARNKMLSDWRSGGGRDLLFNSDPEKGELGALWNFIYGVRNIIRMAKGEFEKIFPPATANTILNATKRITDLTKQFREWTEDGNIAEKLKNIFNSIGQVADKLKNGAGLLLAAKGIGTIVKMVGGLSRFAPGALLLGMATGLHEIIVKMKESGEGAEALRRLFTNVRIAAGKIKETIVQVMAPVQQKLSEMWNSELVTNALIKMVNKLAALAQMMPDLVNKLLAWGKATAETIQQSRIFERTWERMKALAKQILQTFENLGTNAKSGLKNLKEAFGDGTLIETLVRKLNEFAKMIRDAIAAFFQVDVSGEESVIGKIRARFEAFCTAITNGLMTMRDDMAKAWTEISSFFTTLFGETIPAFFIEIKNKVTSFVEKVAAVDWIGLAQSIFEIYAGVQTVRALGGIFTLGRGIGEIGKGLKKLGTGLGKAGKSLKDIGTGIGDFVKKGITLTHVEQKKDSIGTTFLKIAGAIALMVGSIYVLGKMDAGVIKQGLGVLTIVAAEMIGISWLMGKIGTDGKAIFKLGVSLALITIPIKALGEMNWIAALRGIGMLGIIMGELAAFMTYAGTGFTGKTAFISLAFSLNIMVVAIKRLAKMDWAQAADGIVMLGIIMGELAVFMQNAGPGFTGKTAFISLAISLNLMLFAVRGLAEMNWTAALRGIGMLGLIMGELAAFMAYAGSGFTGKTSFISLALSINLLVFAIKNLTSIDFFDAIEGVIGLGIMLTELGVFMRATSGVGKTAGLLGLALSISVLVNAVKRMGNLDGKTIEKGVLGIGGVLTAAGVMAKLTNGANIIPAAAMMLMLAGFITTFTMAFERIQSTSIEKLVAFSEGLATIMVACALVVSKIKVISTIPITSALTGLASFAILIGGIGGIIIALGALNEQWGDMDRLLGKGGKVMQKIGKAIGQLIGGIGAGIVEGVDLPAVGKRLSEFYLSAKPFLEGMSSLKIRDYGIWERIFGLTNEQAFARDMVAFADALEQYAIHIGGFEHDVSDADSTKAIAAATALNNFATNATFTEYTDWEKLNFIDTDLETFSKSIPSFADGMKAYATALGDFTEKISTEDSSQAIAAANALVDFAIGLKDNVDTSIWTRLGWVKSDLATFSKDIPIFAIAMGAYAESLGDFTETISTEDSSQAIDAATALANFAQGLPEKVNYSIWERLGWVKSNLATFSADIPAFSFAMGQYAFFLGKFATTVSNKDSTEAIAAATALANFAQGLPEKVNYSIWERLGWVKSNLATFSKDIPTFATAMKAYATNVGGFSKEVSFRDATRAAMVANGLAMLANSVPDNTMWENLFGITNFGTFADTIGDFGSGLKKYAENVKGFGSELDDEDVKDISSTMTALAEFIAATRVDYDSYTYADFYNIANALKTFGEDYGAFVEGIQKAGTPENQDDVIALLTAFSGLSDEWNNFGKDSANQYIEGLKGGLLSNAEVIKITLKNISDENTNALNKCVQSWFIIGRNYGAGLANGIRSMAYVVYNASAFVANEGIRGSREMLRIGSPSKIAEEQGMYWDMGLAGGMRKYASIVSQGASDVGERVTGSGSMLSAKLEEMLSNIDTEPTIRPVIDDSALREGVYAANRLFESNKPDVSMFGGMNTMRNVHALAYASREGRMQNHGNRDVVAEIEKLNGRFDELTQAVGNMQIILDSGVLVGQTSHKMDRQLGVLAGRRERGN